MVKVRNAKDRLITNKKQYMKTPNKMKTPAKFNAKLEAAVDSGDIKPGKFADAVKAGAPMKTPMKMNKKPGSAMDMKSGFKMKSGPMNMKVKGSVAKMAGVSPTKHKPWAEEHKEKSAHSATAEAHGKQPKYDGQRGKPVPGGGAASRPENQ